MKVKTINYQNRIYDESNNPREVRRMQTVQIHRRSKRKFEGEEITFFGAGTEQNYNHEASTTLN